jgi:hypothetical protein
MSPKQKKRQHRVAVPGRARAAAHNGAMPAAFGHPRLDGADAFMPDPDGGPAHIEDDLAENLAEEFIQSATRGSDADDDALDGVVPEEIGGPFVETSAAEEFADDVDDANPLDAEPEPLPRPVAGLIQNPIESDDQDDT